MKDCIFCQIAQGNSPAHKIWEDDKHLSFLSIFPNTEGFTVTIPKQHYDSNALHAEDSVLTALTLAAKQTAKLLENSLEDVNRVGLIFEGFGVDHLHAKLFPMHGTKTGTWQQHKTKIDKYFTYYEGYIATNDYLPADSAQLSALAKKIKEGNV